MKGARGWKRDSAGFPYKPVEFDVCIGDVIFFYSDWTVGNPIGPGEWQVTSIDPPRGIYLSGNNPAAIGREFGLPWPLDSGRWKQKDEFDHYVNKLKQCKT